MEFWKSIKPTGFNLPLVPKINQNPDNERNNKNSNIFNNLLQQVPNDTFEKSHKRLNATDSEILNKNLIQYLPTDSLRLELQLENAEKELKEVDEEIKAVKLLEMDRDKNKLFKLEVKKELINREINDYRSQYRDLGVIYKITDLFTENFNKAKERFQEAKVAFQSNSFVIKAKNLIPGLKEKDEAQNILEKFNALQANTKKIFSVKTNPFGEKEDYFKDLTALMTKANKLDFQTNKFFSSTLSTTREAKNKFLEKTEQIYTYIDKSIKNLKEKLNSASNQQ